MVMASGDMSLFMQLKHHSGDIASLIPYFRCSPENSFMLTHPPQSQDASFRILYQPAEVDGVCDDVDKWLLFGWMQLSMVGAEISGDRLALRRMFDNAERFRCPLFSIGDIAYTVEITNIYRCSGVTFLITGTRHSDDDNDNHAEHAQYGFLKYTPEKNIAVYPICNFWLDGLHLAMAMSPVDEQNIFVYVEMLRNIAAHLHLLERQQKDIPVELSQVSEV